MKKEVKKKYLVLFLLPVIAMMGCAASTNSTKEMNEPLKIGVSVYNQNDVFIDSILENLKEEALSMEKDTDAGNITLNIVDGQNSQTVQNDQVDKFLSQGCQVLCINMVDRTAAATIIDKAKSYNVPIIFFNREPVGADMKRWERVYYVGSMPEEAGIMQGKIILDEYLKDPYKIDQNHDGKIQYVILEGEQGHQDSLIRTEYCLKPLLDQDIPLEKLANGIANWQKSQSEEKMNSWLKEFNDRIEVVFSNNDEMALGAIAAIKKAGYAKRIWVVGVDGTEAALKAVENGEMLGTVINNAGKQAQGILDIAYLAGNNRTVDEKSIVGMKNRSVKTSHEPVISQIK